MSEELEQLLSKLDLEQLKELANNKGIDSSECEIKEEYIVVIADSNKVTADDIELLSKEDSSKKSKVDFSQAEKLLMETKQIFDSGDFLSTINKATEAIDIGAQALKSFYGMGLGIAIESSESMISDVKGMGIDTAGAEEMLAEAKKIYESNNFEDAGKLIGDLKDVLSELEMMLAEKASEFIAVVQSNIDSGKKIKADMSEAEDQLNAARTQLSDESKLAALSTARKSDSKAKEAIEKRIIEISDLIAKAKEAIEEAKYLNAPVTEAEELLASAQKEFDGQNYIKAEEDANSALQSANDSRDDQIQKAIRYKEKMTVGGAAAVTAQIAEPEEKPAEDKGPKTCPTCGSDATYVQQYDRYYCYTCSAYIEPVDKGAEPEAAKVCPNCGGEPKYVEQYQRYYCYTCNEYVEPVEKKEGAEAEEKISEEPAEGPKDEVEKVCPKCGRVPKYVEQYQRYYCYSCNEYVEPVEKGQGPSEDEAALEEKAAETKEVKAAKVCPKCGGTPKYVEQYDRYYCYTCSEYVTPDGKKDETEEEKAEGKTCPNCGSAATYVEQYDRYYCYTCSKYI